MLLVLALLAAAPASPQATGRLALYVFSLDSEFGFRDDLVDVFRRELGRHAEPLVEVGYSRAEADVAVQFLGQGELTLELTESGASRGYSFRPDERAPRMWALVHVGEYSRPFAVEGTGTRKVGELGNVIASWLREHSSTLRERRSTH